MTPLLYSEPWHLDWLGDKERKMNSTLDHEDLRKFVLRVIEGLMAIAIVGLGTWFWLLFGS